ncbi:MAG: phosphoenolpyruvate--protein phosphotransferase [Xanthomonadales bacterium]|nr:phosphoenolpyruvate--protein phosphotransferase [Xanthomonadales bacterium]
MTMAVQGTGVSRGIAIGKVHIARRHQLEISQRAIRNELVEQEVMRFRKAVADARAELREVRDRIPPSTPAEVLEFIDAHALMLEDGALTEPPAQAIRDLECNAEWALQVHRNRLAAVFDDMDDPYLASRIDDVDQVISRIQRHLMDETDAEGERHENYRGIVLVADDLAPADLTLLYHNGLAGLVTEFGGPLSHTAILARSLKIPAAMGVHHARQLFLEDEQVLVDGGRGIVIADANRTVQSHYRARLRAIRKHQRHLDRLKDEEAVTRCGTRIMLEANLDLPADLELVGGCGAEGIGLYRTEYLFLNRPEPPSEDEQYESYVEIINSMHGRPVTIRTMDLGADKPLPGRSQRGDIPVNPAMGLRAIRLCLNDHSLFIPQLRAIVRAASAGPVRLMIPMVSTAQELFQVKNLLKLTIRDLKREGHEVPERMPIGAMIEVPAAAIAAGTIAKYVDFLSIGTNDLIQYTLAIDRIDDQVSYLYDPLHPSILRLLQMTIEAGANADKEVSMCGEMAGDPRYTRLLLGMGLRDFSMHPGGILEVKQVVKATHLDEIQPYIRRIMRATNPLRISTLVREMNSL